MIKSRLDSPSTTRITLCGGKYSVLHENGLNLRAERYGEAWRDCEGDGLILALAQRIEELEKGIVVASAPRVAVVCEKCQGVGMNELYGGCDTCEGKGFVLKRSAL